MGPRTEPRCVAFKPAKKVYQFVATQVSQQYTNMSRHSRLAQSNQLSLTREITIGKYQSSSLEKWPAFASPLLPVCCTQSVSSAPLQLLKHPWSHLLGGQLAPTIAGGIFIFGRLCFTMFVINSTGRSKLSSWNFQYRRPMALGSCN